MRERVEQIFDGARDIAAHVAEIEVSHGISAHLDHEFLDMAHRASANGTGNFFGIVDEAYIERSPRPDAINHHRTLLPPNLLSGTEQEEILGLLDLMHGAQVADITRTFSAFAEEHDIFGRLRQGAKFILSSNHLELPDQGFTLGYMHRAAREHGMDRFENAATVVIGRLLGYHTLGDKNVIDDILRKAGSVLKSFPVSGSESLQEAQFAKDELGFIMRAFRSYSNHQTRLAFSTIIESQFGQIIFQAGGGAKEEADEFGVVNMNPIGKGTQESLIDACSNGAEVVPLFVDYGSDHSLVAFGEPRPVSNPDDVHDVGTEIAKMGNAARDEAMTTHPQIRRFRQKISYKKVA